MQISFLGRVLVEEENGVLTEREREVVACEEVRVTTVRENNHASLVIHASPE